MMVHLVANLMFVVYESISDMLEMANQDGTRDKNLHNIKIGIRGILQVGRLSAKSSA